MFSSEKDIFSEQGHFQPKLQKGMVNRVGQKSFPV